MKGLTLAAGSDSLRAGVLWVFAVVVLATFGLGGCGSAGTSTSDNTHAAAPPTLGAGTAATGAEDRPGKPGAPSNGSKAPVDKPRAEPERSAGPAKRDRAASSPARAVGRRACAGLTPLEAARRYELAGRAAGVEKRFAAMVAHPPPSVRDSAGYPRLVAAVFAATQPTPTRAEAAAGCAEELARSGQ